MSAAAWEGIQGAGTPREELVRARATIEQVATEREQREPLTPCPFCGSTAVAVVGYARRHAWVMCYGCRATGPDVVAPEPGTEAAAIRQWNTRRA
jgi:Lar family restriction alleviation protein